MSQLTLNIERVVREVLAEMGIGKAESREPKADDDGQSLKAASLVPSPSSPTFRPLRFPAI